ncbi:MAG: beta strand repeat-containing protein [Terrimicrobiaceae bacterium]
MLGLSTNALAADSAWTAPAGGTWITSGNWSAGVPGSNSTLTNPETATFNATLTGASTVNVDANRNIKNIIIDSASNAFKYTITGGSLKLTDGGGIYQISGGNQSSSVGSTIEIQGNGGSATFSNNATGVLTIANPVSGVSTAGQTTTLYLAGTSAATSVVQNVISDGVGGGKLAIVKNGTTKWKIDTSLNINTYSGGFTLNAGTIEVGKNSALGTGTFTINGGTLYGSSASTLTVSNTVINSDFTWGAANSVNLGTGDVSLGTVAGGNATRYIAGAGNAAFLTINGTISNGVTATGLTLGSGVFINVALGGNNTFTGGVYMNRGSLTLTHANALGTGALTMNSDSGNNNLNVTDGLSFANNLVLTNAVALTGTGNMTWTGSVTNSGGSRAMNRTGNTDIVGAVYLSENNTNGRTLTIGGTNNGSGSISGVISNWNGVGGGNGGITKLGTGIWTISGNNTYSGTTTVTAGTLLINGDQSAANGGVTVAAAGTLGGSGIIGGTTNLNGTLSPGNSPGTITFATLNVNTGSTVLFEAGDLVNVTGQLDLNATWTLSLASNANWQLGGTTVLFDYGTLAATPSLSPTILDNTGLGGSGLTVTDNGSQILLNGYSVVPEPATWGLLAFSLTTVMVLRRRRRS